MLRFTFILKTGIGLPKTGISFYCTGVESVRVSYYFSIKLFNILKYGSEAKCIFLNFFNSSALS